MIDLFDKIQEAASFLKDQWSKTPKAGIILGTGLGPLADKIEVDVSIDYEDIPNFLK